MLHRERGATVLTALLVLLGSSVMLAGALIYHTGIISVHVQTKGPDGKNIRVMVPALLVPLGMQFIPDDKLRQAARQIQPWLPTIKAAGAELDRIPEGTLVEVLSERETVSIVKRGNSLVIDINSRDETVHVSFPIKLVLSIAKELESAAPPAETPEESKP